MLFDRANIYVEGGSGGNGVVSFRREAHVPRGGPDGGDGGRGGDVVLVCDAQRRDLSSLGRSRHFRAGRGEHGKGKRRHGERGEDRVIPVPPGTVVRGLDGSEAELLEDGQRVVVARGGSGGHGNKRFATSTRQAPRFAERGLEGESGEIELHLKLLADVGLIGLPNAGKSSLLARLTRADPKVADYPFTTVEPNLGTIELDDRQFVLADIPGLIEGAAEGAGLGHEFLAHLERCRLLVHLVEVAPAEGDPESNYGGVRSELAGYGAGLDELPEVIALSKIDLIPPSEVGAAGGGMARAARVARRRGARHLVGHGGGPRRARADDLRRPPGGRRSGRGGRSSRPSTASIDPARTRDSMWSGKAMAASGWRGGGSSS